MNSKKKSVVNGTDRNKTKQYPFFINDVLPQNMSLSSFSSTGEWRIQRNLVAWMKGSVVPDDEWFIIFNLSQLLRMNKDHLSRLLCGIHNSLTYLSTNQLEYGEFHTYISKNPELQVCYFDSSPFVTSQVLYSLSFISNPMAEKMTEKGTAFLIEEMTNDGLAVLDETARQDHDS